MFSFELTVTPPDTFSVSYSSDLLGGRPTAGPSDSAVYRVMSTRAFDQLATRLRDAFFATRPGSTAP